MGGGEGSHGMSNTSRDADVRAVSARGEIALLLLHETRRLAARVRRPEVGVWLGIGLPAVLVAGGLWAAGERALPALEDVAGAVMWGFLVSVPLSFFAYGILFRPVDDPFLRRLGVSARALFVVRALRLLGLALLVALVAVIPALAVGAPLRRPLAITLGALLPAWGLALLTLTAAARSIARTREGHRPGISSRFVKWDRELAAVAPLAYAPLVPLFGGMVAAGVVAAAPGAEAVRALILSLASVGVAALAARPFALALPRFAPQALEMTYSPPPAAGEAGLAPRRGLARLLPRRVALVRARDLAVAERRFRWASTLIWPVALASFVALGRWGDDPMVRGWVLAAGVLALLAQAGAVIGLGRLERRGPRWIDRSAGISAGVRWSGRWAFGFGLVLWLVIPLGIFWGLWAPVGSGWLWLLAGGATAAVAALASVSAAGR
ncbi:hypothetical protein BH23GEM7_BH23GEM7_42140 [soil metagenome]